MHIELARLIARSTDSSLMFQEVMSTIRRHYECTPVAFSVGESTPSPVRNPAGTNAASSQLLAFGKRLGLDEQTLLGLYAEHYRDVLADPAGSNHANIRAFMTGGWAGVSLPADPLRLRGPG
ncbi:MAG: HopJ type III effector protein [Pseudomonadota bacterium]